MNQIRYLVGHPRNVVNKARLFDDDFRANNGEAHAKKIVGILCRYDTTMTKTLGAMQKLLEPQPPIRVVVPTTTGSPSIVIQKEGESSATPRQTEFRVPKTMEKETVHSPQINKGQTKGSSRIQSPVRSPVLTVAELIRREEARLPSPEAR